jgi:fimbrial chaperone protein
VIGRLLAAALGTLALAFALPAAAPALGSFDIKPVNVTFAPGASSASVEFTNVGPTPQELEVAVKSWTSSDGSDDGEATDDIVASPSIFIVAPGQTQLVRLGPARDLSGDIERTYRLVATEVPQATSGARVQTILRMRLPVFIAPHAVNALPLTWHVARADPARLVVTSTNAGNVHKRIRSLRVSADGRVVFDEVVAAYVLAHQSRQWSVPLKSAEAAQAVTVHATEMDGATENSSFSVR